MAVSHETSHVTEVNIVKRVQHLANAANPAFAAGSLLVPLAFLGASLLLSSTELLFIRTSRPVQSGSASR